MRYLKVFEDFDKVKNITDDDIVQCIKKGGKIYATIIDNLPKHDSKEPLTPLSIDEEGSITCFYDNKECEVKLRNVDRIA